MKIQLRHIVATSLLMLISVSGCIKEDHFGKSAYHEILQFALPLQLNATVIDQEWMGRQTWECRTITPGPARWVPTDGYCRR